MLSARQRPSLKQERAERRQRKKAKQQEQELMEKVKQQQRQKQHRPEPRTYTPSFSLVFRILALIRVVGALTAPIQDCDEVYNYWEPLHFLQFKHGKQTWEYAPQYALRSYGFLEIYVWMARALHFILGFAGKVQVFYGVRILLAMVTAACEAGFVRAIAVHVDRRIANYTMMGLFGMAGMYHAAVALLPTSFAMCCGMVGGAAAMVPAWQGSMWRRTVVATGMFAVMAVVGWPYAAVMAVPYMVEEVVERGRVKRTLAAIVTGIAVMAVAGGMLAMVDSQYYGRFVVASWNQVKYNVVSGHSDLYGTEPWHFYIKNGLINGNLVMALALLSLPMWAAYYLVLRATAVGTGPMVERLFTSHRLLLYRIMPFFVVLLVFSVQRHKEERFLSIAYPHMCFNAAVCLSLLHPLRAWLQARTGRAWSARSDSLNLSVLAVAGAIGLLRMGALYQYYGGYSSVFLALPGHSASNGLLPLGPTIKTLWGSRTVRAEPGRQRTVCMGKEWYRFPSSYWLPEGFRLEFVPSQFSGHLPGSFNESATGAERSDFNDMNRWEPRHVVDEAVCDYAVDTEFGAAAYAENEVPFARRSGWQKRMCEPVLDPQRTRLWERVVYVPGGSQRWGEVCIFERDQSSGDPGMV